MHLVYSVKDFFDFRYASLVYDSPDTITWIYLLGTNENNDKQSSISMYYQVPGSYAWQGNHHLPFCGTKKNS